MMLTTPLVATMGLSLTIPLALVGDLVIEHVRVGAWYCVGASLVVGGFVLLNTNVTVLYECYKKR